MGKLEPSKENFVVGSGATMAEKATGYLAIDNSHSCGVELVWSCERELGNKQSNGTVRWAFLFPLFIHRS